jgi:uncharacterized membrane protein
MWLPGSFFFNHSHLDHVFPTAVSTPKIRLHFLDALRAFAILMMLQGHFVDTLLAPEYRDLGNPIFNAWTFMRGLTAPVFFTVTGIVFVFLLLKENKPLREHVRVRKGIRRAFFLVALAYLLKWNAFSVLTLNFAPYHIAVDVLHVIGLALLALIGIYALHRVTGVSYPIVSGLLGLVVFLVFPKIELADWSHLPIVLQNYLTMQNGSVFTVFPWLGYTLIGGVIGSIVHYQTSWFKRWWMPAILLIAGLWLHFSAYTIFANVHQMLGWELSQLWLGKHYLFWRFGHVLIVLSVFVFLEQVLKKGFHPLFLKIGSETLTVYGAHYVILYGTWFGIGLSQLWKHALTPGQTIIGVLLFEVFFILLIAHIEKVRQVWYEELPAALVLAFRRVRVMVLRRSHRILLDYRREQPAIIQYIHNQVFQILHRAFHLIPAKSLRRYSK